MSRNRSFFRPGETAMVNQDSWQSRGLVYWWPLNDRQGHSFLDPANQKLSGSSGSPLTESFDHGGTCMRNDGTARYVNVTSWVWAGTTPITMSAWVRPYTVSSAIRGIQRGNGTGGPSLYLWSSNKWSFYIGSGISIRIDTATSAVVGRLDHICATWTGADAAIYVNGVPENSGALSATGTASTSCRIGGDQFSQHFDGQIADIRNYSRAFGADEVWQLYDPRTRWELYWVPQQRFYSFGTPAAAGFKSAWARGSNIVISGGNRCA